MQSYKLARNKLDTLFENLRTKILIDKTEFTTK